MKFAEALEKVCVETVESGDMTRDLTILIGTDHPWLTTNQFLDKLDSNLQKATAELRVAPLPPPGEHRLGGVRR